MTVLKQLSYTYLHTLACSYQVFLRYEGKLKGPITSHLALGNAAHLALEMLHLNKLSRQEMMQIYLDEYERITQEDNFFATYPQIKKGQGEGVNMLTKYYDQMEAGYISSTPLAVEKEFRLPILDIEIVGKIDKVEESSEGLIVTDYKSGSTKPAEWLLRRNLQFTAYYWACKEMYGEYPAKVQWHHLRTGEILTSERDEWDIEQLKRIVEAAIHLQNQDLRYRVYHEKVCDWCSYSGIGGACDDPLLEAQILARRTT